MGLDESTPPEQLTGRSPVNEVLPSSVIFQPSPSGAKSEPYGVVFTKGAVWYSESGAKPNTIVRFDPLTEKFNAFPSNMPGANVRQLDGRPGETWGGESGTNRLVVIQTVAPA